VAQITTQEDKSTIKQGTIAEFMRKRTQLVGFEFGYWKHSQYLAEFLDNALDAIESFQWNEVGKINSTTKFTLDRELTLENLSILQKEKEEEKSQPLDEEARLMIIHETGMEPVDTEVKTEEIIDKIKIEVEAEVKKILDHMEEILIPVENIIDDEPLVIVRLTESKPPTFLTSEISQKNIMNYSFEIFDNGTGMNKLDLKKFGKYLASSKSTELKQTRGSQGFGAPSAFSDSQNTTGSPIIAVSKTIDNVYATASEFFTTSKNEKKYLIHPTEVDCPFIHGTYIKLDYLNVKYIRGYVDVYIKETALMNPHITIIFLDPYNEEFIYSRKVSNFPIEPKYAKAHPSSTNIGDLQDLLTKTENLTISSFLKENFVRVTSKTAKQIINLAERELQDKLNFLILNSGFINKLDKKTDPIHYIRFEKRIYGRSQKPRDKLMIYEIISDDLKNKYWDLVSNYNQLNQNHKTFYKKIQKQNSLIEKADTQKEIKNFEKNIRGFLDEIDGIRKQKDNIRTELDKIITRSKDGLQEVKKFKDRSDYEDLVNEIQLSKAKPAELTTDQFNSLFFAFKSIKYMAPPTDTAIPVGEAVLESTLIKEIGLRVTDNLDDYDTPVEKIKTSNDILLEEKKSAKIRTDPDATKEIFDEISVSNEDIQEINSLILSGLDIEDQKIESDQLNQSLHTLISYQEGESTDSYEDLFEFFEETYSREDDFVAAVTRDPTSGKGLAYVVEAGMAYSKLIEVPKRSRDVLSRFVNRTPKLRDSADCAITKAVQSVNWKNYKLEVYDNNLPKGPIKVLVNVSGPYVHLMFKSQSKSSLADDEDLIKEIKYALEALGRKLRVYLNRRANIHQREKRASLFEKYIPIFVKSLYNIASSGDSRYKTELKEKDLQERMINAIGKKPVTIDEAKPEHEEAITKPVKPTTPEAVGERKPEIIHAKKEEIKIPPKLEAEIKEKKEEIPDFDKLTVTQLRDFARKKNINVHSKIKKADVIKKIQDSLGKKKVIEKTDIRKPPIQRKIVPAKTAIPAKAKPKPTTKPTTKTMPSGPQQTQLPIITNENIVSALSKDEWQTIKHLIFKMKIRDMMDARFLQIKLKELERKGKVLVDIKMSKKHWKLK